MELITSLPSSPERITDIGLLERALYSLQEKSQAEGREYVFEHTQQPMVGGTCRLAPVAQVRRSQTTRVLGSYDAQYFEKRLEDNY